MMKFPVSPSHLTPSPLAEKLLAFSSFTLSIKKHSWKKHFTQDGSKTPVRKCRGCLVMITFFCEGATDLSNSRIHCARLCPFHCLEIHMASQMAPNTEQALREHLFLLMQKSSGSEQYQCRINRTGNSHKATEPRNQNSLKNNFWWKKIWL